MTFSRFRKISRWVPWWPFLVGSYLIGAGNMRSFSSLSWIELLFMIPLAFFINGINDVYDTKSDEINPRKIKEGSEGGVLKEEEISTVLKIAAVIAVLFLVISIFSFSLIHVALVSSFLFLSFAYSHKWFRLRDIPLLDSFIGGSVLCLFPALIAFSLNNSVLNLPLGILWIILPFMSFHAIAASEDIEPDQKARMNSIAISLGRKKVKILATLLIGIASIFAILSRDIFLISVLGVNLLNFISLIFLKEEDQPRMVLASFVTSWLIILAYYISKENIYIVEFLSSLISF